MNSLLVIDDFLSDPDSVRSQALNSKFYSNKINDTSFPGKRTDVIASLNPHYNSLMFKKLTTLLFNVDRSSYSVDIKSYFQLVGAKYNHGWVHADDDSDSDIAGVLYLNPNPPIDSGTKFYKQISKEIDINLIKKLNEIKKQFVMGGGDPHQALNALNENNSCFELTDYVSNKYNRLILYPSKWYHCAGQYFGDTNENSRLTQVFFIKCISHNSDVKYFIDKVRFS